MHIFRGLLPKCGIPISVLRERKSAQGHRLSDPLWQVPRPVVVTNAPPCLQLPRQARLRGAAGAEGAAGARCREGRARAGAGPGARRVEGPGLASPPLREPRARPAAERPSRQQGAPRSRRARGRGAQSRRRSRPESRPRLPLGCCSAARLGTRPGGSRSPEPVRAAGPAAPPLRSAPARKRGRRGGGAGKRFRGRGARAGAAAGAAGTGLAPAAAEGTPRAGDVSAALSAGEARRRGRRAAPAGLGAAPGRCPAPSGRGGGSLRAWSVRRAGGWAGGAGCSRGRAGSGGPGHLLGPGARPRGPEGRAPKSGRRWRGRGSRSASCPGLLSLRPGRPGILCFRAPRPRGAPPFYGAAGWLSALESRAGPGRGVGPASGFGRAPAPRQRLSPGKQAAARRAWP